MLNPAAAAHIARIAGEKPELAAMTDALGAAAEMICAMHRAGGKLLLCGNGGSAADAMHIAGELIKSFVLPRPVPESLRRELTRLHGPDGEFLADRLQQGVAAIALTDSPTVTSAIINDVSAELMFAQQVMALGRPGDVLIALSTSGRARNVLRAAQAASALGLRTIAFTGSADSPLAETCGLVLRAPSTETFRVQEHHLALYHALCLAVEAELFG